jgi:hypothetical protein
MPDNLKRDIRSRYEESVEELRTILALGKQEAGEQHPSIPLACERYQLLQRAMVFTLLRERKLTWCTSCRKLIPLKEARFVLTQGRELDAFRARKDSWELESFCYLSRSCDSCFRVDIARDGEVKYESVREEPETFNAHPVELRQDVLFFMEIEAEWEPVPADAFRCLEGSKVMIEELARVLEVPVI